MTVVALTIKHTRISINFYNIITWFLLILDILFILRQRSFITFISLRLWCTHITTLFALQRQINTKSIPCMMILDCKWFLQGMACSFSVGFISALWGCPLILLTRATRRPLIDVSWSSSSSSIGIPENIHTMYTIVLVIPWYSRSIFCCWLWPKTF